MDYDPLARIVLPKQGSYILISEVSGEAEIVVGALGAVAFHKGYYAYVGSALGGLYARLSRHLGNHKKLHWHIDYLLLRATITSVIVCGSQERRECAIAEKLGSGYRVIPGFGSSDCSCAGHLFFSPSNMTAGVMNLLELAGMEPQNITIPPE